MQKGGIFLTKNILKIVTIWSSGAMIYGLIEIMFRGFTHITMGVLGGICLLLIDLINRQLGFHQHIILKMLLSAIIITSLEFITGMFLNVLLRLDIWDYSNIPLNLYGQICLPFFVAWFFLSLLAIKLIDFIRWKIFDEPKPQYFLSLKKV